MRLSQARQVLQLCSREYPDALPHVAAAVTASHPHLRQALRVTANDLSVYRSFTDPDFDFQTHSLTTRVVRFPPAFAPYLRDGMIQEATVDLPGDVFFPVGKIARHAEEMRWCFGLPMSPTAAVSEERAILRFAEAVKKYWNAAALR